MNVARSLAGFHCKPEHIISPDNFHKLQLVSANLCDDDYVTRCAAAPCALRWRARALLIEAMDPMDYKT